MLIVDSEKIETYYQALLERSQSFVGIFFVGVKTTDVFCIATCSAKKPKKENVEFYTTFKEVLNNGYSPCKVCNPTENANIAPEQVKNAISLVKENPKEKITDFQLKQKEISPQAVCAWFKNNYGITFQTYQRMYRINNAFQELKQRKNTTHTTAFEIGYESLSGFGYTLKKTVGKTPKKNKNENLILINRLTTPLGPMFVCATNNGICLLEFVDRRMLETEFKDLQKLLNAVIILGENKYIKQAKQEVDEYFKGTRKTFDVKIETPGTDFQNKVWSYLRKIEYGTTTTYQKQSEQINNPKAIRAVASANGYNRISIIIPCHRVIGKDGKMTGYGGGIERKKWLIKHEQKDTSTQQTLWE